MESLLGDGKDWGSQIYQQVIEADIVTVVFYGDVFHTMFSGPRKNIMFRSNDVAKLLDLTFRQIFPSEDK